MNESLPQLAQTPDRSSPEGLLRPVVQACLAAFAGGDGGMLRQAVRQVERSFGGERDAHMLRAIE